MVKQKDSWSRNGKKVVVGYIGRLAPEKQVERLEALRHPGIQLVVVGSRPSQDKLQRTLPSETIFTGKLTGESLANAYASLDIFVHTGEDETFGQTLQEAMASQLPVVAPAKGGPLDIVSHSETGFLYEPGDSQSLRAYVGQLAEDRETREYMGRAGYEKVRHTNWDNVMSQLLDYHDETMDMHRREGY